MSQSAIRYQVSASDCNGHYFTVSMHIPAPDKKGQQLRLPAWLPGSYMIRDFAKNIITLQAYSDGQQVEVIQLDKQQWQIAKVSGPLDIVYQVYARDLSVRTAYLDDEFGFYNHSALCLEALGQADSPCEVSIQVPTTKPDWKLATGMPRVSGEHFGEGRFMASNYDELIDFPVLMGDLSIQDFIAQGTRHQIVLAGQHHADMQRISGDLARICETQLDLFDDQAPFEHYTFLVMVVGNGFGGLEHRNSTALLCSRKDLIHANQQGITDSYRTFLSLCSHEYFHSWNVKRLRPREFIPFQLDKEQYTEQLWFYEGVTSYYDDYLLHRAGLSSATQYLQSMAATMSRALTYKGAQRQSITQSSKLAWTTFYQQNENAPNAIASYYSKGAVTALCLDLLIRRHSEHQHSLDDVMRYLWNRLGKPEKGTRMEDLTAAFIQFGGKPVEDFLQLALYSTEPLPVEELLKSFGVDVQYYAAETESSQLGKKPRIQLPVALGARYQASEQGLVLQQVFEQGAAYEAGLSAGDRIIAIDNLQIGANNQLEFWSRYQPGDQAIVHAFRRDQLQSRPLVFQAAEKNNIVLEITDPEQLNGWLSTLVEQ
ncbi:aminopeptidase [Aliidiomarina minuta]|uniref:Aminopeptidase n=1 Tax=Aliidiomarina minuta TaxID=880057 RepID=A0A432W6T1_9GAMM|nr:PDZ domain-containing protein [Aliidiomarina minuta]RUO25731.1 aminopeptidase [Aliidiomarina minuta]